MAKRFPGFQYRHILSLVIALSLHAVVGSQIYARLGCSYEDIKTIRDLVSVETSEKYLGWICEGKRPEEKPGYEKLRQIKSNRGIFGTGGVDSVHLEYGPLGLFSTKTRALDVYYQHMNLDRIAFGVGLIKLKGIPALKDLFVLGGYNFNFEGIGDVVPQLRYGSGMGFKVAAPFTMQFGPFSAGATVGIGNSNRFSIGLHGSYLF